MKATILPLLISLSGAVHGVETNFIEVGQQRVNFQNDSGSPEGTFVTFNKKFNSFYLEAHVGKSSDNIPLVGLGTDINYGFNTSTIAQHNLRQTVSQRYIKFGKFYPYGETGIFDLSLTAGDFDLEHRPEFIISEVSLRDTIETRQTATVTNDVGQVAVELVYHDNITDTLTGKIGIGYELNNDNSSSDIKTFSIDGGGDSSYVFIAGLALPVTQNIFAKLNYRDANEYNELSASLAWRF